MDRRTLLVHNNSINNVHVHVHTATQCDTSTVYGHRYRYLTITRSMRSAAQYIHMQQLLRVTSSAHMYMHMSNADGLHMHMRPASHETGTTLNVQLHGADSGHRSTYFDLGLTKTMTTTT